MGLFGGGSSPNRGASNFDIRRAQEFQSSILARIKRVQQMIDQQVTSYYTRDRVDDERDYYENLRGLHHYLREAYRALGTILNDIERRKR